MPMLAQRVARIALVALVAGTAACAARQAPPAAPAVASGTMASAPAPIADEQLASAVRTLVADGTASEQRQNLLTAVVRRMFARAAERLEAGQQARGLATLSGALYLVRVGELRPEMLDASAARACELALAVVAPRGEEGKSLALLHLRYRALAANDPSRAEIDEHLAALDTWMRDTRHGSEVEKAEQDQKTLGERSVLEPTPENLNQAAEVTQHWVEQAIELTGDYRPSLGVDAGSRDKLMAAFTGVRVGALALAALYLRNGDAISARQALERSEARRVMPPAVRQRLEAASLGADPAAWRELSAVYASIGDSNLEGVQSLSTEVTRGAAWGAAVEAYRRAPAEFESSLAVAEMLARLGMADASAATVAESVRRSADYQRVAVGLKWVLKLMVQEQEEHDAASTRSVFRAAAPLLSAADAFPNHAQLEPSPAQLRFAMAFMEARVGELASARSLLQQGLRERPSMEANGLLAAILAQSGDQAGALGALKMGLQSADAAANPMAQADAHLLAFRIHRQTNALDAARADLSEALRIAREARSQAVNAADRARAERLLARIAFHYGSREGFARAIDRGFEAAAADKNLLGAIAIEATADDLLWGDVKHARETLRRALDTDIADEDLVYAALWVRINELTEHASPEDVTQRAFARIDRNGSWSAQLAAWAEGTLTNAKLLERARDLSQHTEADFYIAMRKRVAADPAAAGELQQLARSAAIQLVETHLAQELSLPNSLRVLGPPPGPLP